MAANSMGRLRIDSARGNPPDHYLLTFRCRGVERLREGRPVISEIHRVEIRLPARYPAPSAPPRVRFLTPIYHPHVYPNREVCIGTWRTTDFLEDFVARLGAMIQYDRRYLDPRDPANEEAIEWAKKNLILFPLDAQTFGQTIEPVQITLPYEETMPDPRPIPEELPPPPEPPDPQEPISGPDVSETSDLIAPMDARDRIVWTDMENE